MMTFNEFLRNEVKDLDKLYRRVFGMSYDEYAEVVKRSLIEHGFEVEDAVEAH